MSSDEEGESVYSNGNFNPDESDVDEAIQNNNDSEEEDQESNGTHYQSDHEEQEEIIGKKSSHKRKIDDENEKDDQLNEDEHDLKEKKEQNRSIMKNSGTIFDSEYYSLHPVENLNINVKADIELKKFGIAESQIDFIVKIKPFDDALHLGYETILFDLQKNPIGEIFEIFGSVLKTMYALRFNSKEEASKILPIGKEVYYAISDENLTKIVLPQELSLLKNWDPFHSNQDSSSSSEEIFSDDEKEKEYFAKKRLKQKRRANSYQSNATTNKDIMLPVKRKQSQSYRESYNQRNPFHPLHRKWQQNSHYLSANNFYNYNNFSIRNYNQNSPNFYQAPILSAQSYYPAYMQQQQQQFSPYTTHFNGAEILYQNALYFPTRLYHPYPSPTFQFLPPPPPPPYPPGTFPNPPDDNR